VADVTERMNYFDRQFLRAKDFQDEQSYHIDRRRSHNAGFHSPGVVQGLVVVPSGTADQVNVQPGWAVDELGREIVLATERSSIPVGGVDMQIWISYPSPEPQTTPSTDPGVTGFTRISEEPVISAVEPGNAPQHSILLANVSAAGAIDNTVRAIAGLQDDTVTSAKIDEADGSTGQDTNRGSGVKTDHIQDAAITQPKIADGAVNGAKIQDGSVGTAKLATNAVTSTRIRNGAVNNSKIANNTISEAKFNAATRGKLVTNGDQHDHSGGDGGQIRHSSLNLDDGTNPHGTTAADVNALPITGGEIEGGLSVREIRTREILISDGMEVHNARLFGETVFNEPVLFRDRVIFRGPKNGYVTDIFANGSGGELHTGDLVKLTPAGAKRFHGVDDKIPVSEVTLSDKDDDPMVIGIVDRLFEQVEDPSKIPDGAEFLAVTLGSYAHCKVDASEESIEVGDLLTSSSEAGHAKKAVEPKIGSIIGKALQPLEDGTGTIAVFVNIQ